MTRIPFESKHLIAFKVAGALGGILLLFASIRTIQVAAEDDLRSTHVVLARLDQLDRLERYAADSALEGATGGKRTSSASALAIRTQDIRRAIDSLTAVVHTRLAMGGLQPVIERMRIANEALWELEERAIDLGASDRSAALNVLSQNQYRSTRQIWWSAGADLRQVIRDRRDADIRAIDRRLDILLGLSLLLLTLFLSAGIYAAVVARRAHEIGLTKAKDAEIQQSILGAVGEGVLGLDAAGRTVFANSSACKLLGYAEREMVGQHQHLLIHYKHRDGTPYPVEDCPIYMSLSDGSTYTADDEFFWTKDGKRITVDLVSTPIRENGKITGVVQAFRDVTEKRQIEEQLKRSEIALKESSETMKAILEAASDAFIATDATGHILQWNESATRTFGWTPEEVLGQTLNETIIPLQHRAAHARGIARVQEVGFEGRINRRLELTALHRDGREFPVEFTITAIKGKSVIFTSFLRDITERVKLAEHVRQNQKLEAMGGLAGGIAHDFNNLLTVILISAEWLGEMVPPEGQPDLHQIIESSKKAQALTQQLLAYSRKQFLRPTSINLNGIVGSVDKMLRRLILADIEIVTILDPSLGSASVDRGQIEQVITNLVINSRDAMPDGGRIIIETKNLDVMVDDSIYKPLAAGKYVLLCVSDNGAGMSEEVQRRAFEPFFTTKPVGQGTGLGLAMVQGIVKQSGGEIMLNSTPGLGTTIRVLFPQLTDGQQQAQAVQTPETLPGVERILVVEDQIAVRQAARRVLDSLGYTVHEASNGEEALKRMRALAGAVDLVLTDLVMPEMGGRELARRLRLEMPDVKVLFMSGYSSETASDVTLESNTVGLLAKPFSRHAIAAAVRKALDT